LCMTFAFAAPLGAEEIDRKQLQAAEEQYEDDVNAHKPLQVLLADLQRIFNDRADIKADEKDLRQDLNGH
jgi:hypothetical protein